VSDWLTPVIIRLLKVLYRFSLLTYLWSYSLLRVGEGCLAKTIASLRGLLVTVFSLSPP
jgi:hypothetical protein